MAAWRRSNKYHDYREASAYGAMLEAWLDQVATELAPKDPAAVALFESFIGDDSTWFDHADDSDGAIRLRHGRKSAFWTHVNGKRLASSDDD